MLERSLVVVGALVVTSIAGCKAPPGGAARPATAFPSTASSDTREPMARDVPALVAWSRHVRCPPREVAPGLWVHLHCGAFRPIAHTRSADPAKLRLMRHGRLWLDRPIGRAVSASADGGEPAWSDVLPASVDHREQGLEGPVAQQDAVGACTAFSLAAAMNNAIRRLNEAAVISPMHLWAHFFSGGMDEASAKNTDRPLSVADVWPYDPVTACKISQEQDGCDGYYHVQKEAPPWDAPIREGLASADARGRWQLSSVTCVAGPYCAPSASADPETIAAYLATGADLWVGMWIDVQAWYHPVSGAIPDYEIPDAAVANDSAPGHSVVLSGYDRTGGSLRFLVHNSWGEGWGDHGYAWISVAMVRKYLQMAYKVTVTDLAHAPSPPNTKNALTDDDCPEDEIVDAQTGRCEKICAGDARSLAGACSGTR